jgi:hypothetical protein
VGETSSLRNPAGEERHAKLSTQNTIFFPLTINGLGNKTIASADLSEQLAGA